ncbi:type IV toxin-antitoxin system AbiEi family antitoxin domain-containing protein [Endothiovibrio diazotrophicus]
MQHNIGVQSHQEATLELARKQGLIRPRDLAAHGLPRVTLTRLVRQGLFVRVGRGGAQNPPCRDLPSLRAPLPRPHHPGPF